MRIFHLVPNLNYGGLQEVVRGLALCQMRSGHSVTIGCWTNASNHPEAERELERAGARIVYLRRGADGTLSYDRLSSLQMLKGCLGARNADILHVHNPFDYYLFGAIAARIAGRTAIAHTLHATVMFDWVARRSAGASRLKVVRTKAQFWVAAMLTDALVSVCAEAELFLRSRFFLPGKELYVVDNGIDLGPFLSVPARPLRNEITFGAVGRMSFEKNHRGLIEAFALLRCNYGNVRLRLLGSGPIEQKLKEQVLNLGLDDVVEFCGFSHDVPTFLGGLDVFVLASISEGMPLSLLEAIASGLPVVATAVGGVPPIVRSTDSGWLCEPRDAHSLCAAMESAIACSDRRNRGERARQLVAEHYSAERMTRDYEFLYRKLLH
jgi:glycosyltransferase involved in cell wall biosynthesis